jgi:hypothetical protein
LLAALLLSFASPFLPSQSSRRQTVFHPSLIKIVTRMTAKQLYQHLL